MVVVVAVLAIAGGITAAVWAEDPGPVHTHGINSLGQSPDIQIGDGACDTGEKIADGSAECTLRAALQEANAQPDNDLVTLAEGFAGGVIPLDLTGSENWMMDDGVGTKTGYIDAKPTQAWTDSRGTSPAGNDWGDGSGAVFVIDTPLTLDLQHKLSPHSNVVPADGGGDNPVVAVFFINGQNITIQGVDNPWSGETSFYVGPLAKNVTITDGSVSTPTYYPERFVVVRGGATNITLSDYFVQGFANDDGGWGQFVVDGTSEEWPVEGLTIRGNTYYTTPTGGACGGTDASGCNTPIIRSQGQFINDLLITGNRSQNLNHEGQYDSMLIDLQNSTVNSVTITDNTVERPDIQPSRPLIELNGAGITALTMTGNSFTGVTSLASETDNGVLRLPTDRAIGKTTIKNNYFITDPAQGLIQIPAIRWNGPYGIAGGTTDSMVTIQDNYFDGWGYDVYRGTIVLTDVGALEVSGNTFGPRTVSQTVTVREEAIDDGNMYATMLQNVFTTSNAKMDAWFPTAVVSTGQSTLATQSQSAPPNVVPPGQTNGHLEPTGCTIDLEVAPPNDPADTVDLAGRPNASVRTPVLPVTLEAYWTNGITAELHLGSYDVSTADLVNGRYLLKVPLPMDTTDVVFDSMKVPQVDDNGDVVRDAEGKLVPVFPDGTTDGSNGASLPVAADGSVHGGLRIQTQDPNAHPGGTLMSSQYSRVAAIGGTCAPSLTIEQQAADAATGQVAQNDPAMGRNVYFTIHASLAIDPTTLTPSDFSVAGSTAPGARVTHVIPGENNRVFTVVARANDSGVITVSLPAGTVTSLTGLDNSASTSVDNQVNYVNPFQVKPSPLTVITGATTQKTYEVGIDSSAPPPTSDLTLTATVDQAGQGFGVHLSESSLVIPSGGTSVEVDVSADEPAAGQSVPAGSPASVAHTVSAAGCDIDAWLAMAVPNSDCDYDDGLVVPDEDISLYSTNPSITVTKAAYVDVEGENTPDNIVKTGTPVPSGGSLNDDEPVWFVFTVTNASGDDWDTELTGITVTDTVLGPIAWPADSVNTLADGASISLAYQANPVAVEITDPPEGS
jgi:adhesin/invasin